MKEMVGKMWNIFSASGCCPEGEHSASDALFLLRGNNSNPKLLELTFHPQHRSQYLAAVNPSSTIAPQIKNAVEINSWIKFFWAHKYISHPKASRESWLVPQTQYIQQSSAILTFHRKNIWCQNVLPKQLHEPMTDTDHWHRLCSTENNKQRHWTDCVINYVSYMYETSEFTFISRHCCEVLQFSVIWWIFVKFTVRKHGCDELYPWQLGTLSSVLHTVGTENLDIE